MTQSSKFNLDRAGQSQYMISAALKVTFNAEINAKRAPHRDKSCWSASAKEFPTVESTKRFAEEIEACARFSSVVGLERIAGRA